jgi:hypothetical protein
VSAASTSGPALTREERYRTTRFATILAAVVNSVLAATQIVTGWLFQSQALIADGVHTLSDLVSDGVVLFAAGKASASPDENHPYGHGRIETLATIVVGLLLAFAALGIGWSAGATASGVADTDRPGSGGTDLCDADAGRKGGAVPLYGARGPPYPVAAAAGECMAPSKRRDLIGRGLYRHRRGRCRLALAGRASRR